MLDSQQQQQQRQQLRRRRLAQLLLLVTSGGSLLACPHSKVEESFNVQATHDLFYHGLGPALRHAYRTAFATAAAAAAKKEVPGASAADIAAPPASSQVLLPYDHLLYPGVVPRTFAGPLLLSTACQIGRLLLYPVYGADAAANNPAAVQFLARLVLLLLSASQWFNVAHALDQRTKRKTIGTYLLLVTACQFHVPFYMSRLLPNTFACLLTLRSVAHWLRGGESEYERLGAAVDMVLATTIFRCDCLLLLFTTGLSWLLCRQLTVGQAVRAGVAVGAVALILTVPLDSLLWQRLVWPEGEVLYYNTILNKSSDWGVSAWHWYWTVALPKSLLLTILFIPLAVFRVPEVLSLWERRLVLQRRGRGTRSSTSSSSRSGGGGAVVASRTAWIDTTWLPFLLPALAFVALYSALGHKEVRFLFPALPLFNLAAAAGLSRLHLAAFPSRNDKTATVTARVGYALAVSALLSSWVISGVFVALSRWNYPGGDALQLLVHRVGSVPPPIRVHIDVAAAMSGVSLFGQRAAQASSPRGSWTFDKAGYEDEHRADTNGAAGWSKFTHLLTETDALATAKDAAFDVVAVAQGHPRLDFRRGAIATSNAIYVLERKGWASEVD